MLVLVLAGCGGKPSYSLEDTRECLESRGVQIGGPLDFVASTATGGAFLAKVGDNSVKIVFGESEDDAKQIERGYDHFAFSNVKSGLPDVLRRYYNTVTLWHEHPEDPDLALVTGCLK